MTSKLSIRDVNGNLINNISIGTITPNTTSNSFIFRVYNNYDQEQNVTPAYNINIQLSLYKNTLITNVFKKPLETEILKNGIIEIDCTISSKLNGGYPNIDWTPIDMSSKSNSFKGTEFDIIYPDEPNNFNEYKIRFNNLEGKNYFNDGDYKVFIRVNWSEIE